MSERQLTVEAVLAAQQNLQVTMGLPMGTGEAAVKENMLALIVEATEVLGEINWKCWKRHQLKEVDRDALLTELTDLLQFWANAVSAMGFTADDVALALSTKWSENRRRVMAGEVTRG